MTLSENDATRDLDDDTAKAPQSGFSDPKPPAADDEPIDEIVEEAPAATHQPTPEDCSVEPPTDDGLNHMGYFRRPAGDDQPAGSTIVIKSHATSDNLANAEREGVMEFLGYVAAAE